jgi:hypothetical protein
MAVEHQTVAVKKGATGKSGRCPTTMMASPSSSFDLGDQAHKGPVYWSSTISLRRDFWWCSCQWKLQKLFGFFPNP